jgi:disulfide bond formation protein DsbB
MWIDSLLAGKTNQARLSLALGGAGLAVVAAANAFEHLAGLRPCALCLYQRWPWWIAAALGLIAFLLRDRPRVVILFLLAGGLAVLTGAGIAVFHVGVEQHWWAGLASCGGGDLPDTVAALRQRLLNAPIVRCDEVAWSLFGISMAGYNALLSVILGSGLCFAAWRQWVDQTR